jgi:hypothetical protein
MTRGEEAAATMGARGLAGPFPRSTLGIISAQFGLAWGVAHSLASNTVSDLLAKVFQLATNNDMVGAPANCAGSARCILFGYSAQECQPRERALAKQQLIGEIMMLCCVPAVGRSWGDHRVCPPSRRDSDSGRDGQSHLEIGTKVITEKGP